MEKRETFFFAGGSAGSGVAAAAVEAGLDRENPGGSDFFFVPAAGLRITDSGLNMSGFPTSFTSDSGFIPSGMDGPAGVLFGGGRALPREEPPPDPDSRLFPSSSSSTPDDRRNAGSAAVRRWTPGAGAPPRADGVGFATEALVFLGGGRKEPKLLKRLPLLLAPMVLARFAGGSSASAEEAEGRLTTILPAPLPERSMSFWNGFLDVVDVDVEAAAGWGLGVGSESESESE